MDALGIDVGGSGIKGAPVNPVTGQLSAERVRVDTPAPATPKNVAKVIADIARGFAWNGPIGVTYPGIVRHGVTLTAANVDKGWVGTNAQALLQEATGCPVVVLNDADAAGVAEMTHGAGRVYGHHVVFMLTFGTGVGSAVFVNRHLLPNTELGHLPMVKQGKEAEQYMAARIRKEEDLSWEQWAKRVNEYLAMLEFFFSPDVFIVGGGASKRWDKFGGLLKATAEIVPAQLLNDAGIVGAAMAAEGYGE
jgi:polyphosphate glucokinase